MDEETKIATDEGSAGSQSGTDEGNQQGQNEEKIYTEKDFQSEVDKRVTEALKTAKSKWETEYGAKLKAEKDEAARLAKMTADNTLQANIDAEASARESAYNTINQRIDSLSEINNLSEIIAAINAADAYIQLAEAADALFAANDIDKCLDVNAYMPALAVYMNYSLQGNTQKILTI